MGYREIRPELRHIYETVSMDTDVLAARLNFGQVGAVLAAFGRYLRNRSGAETIAVLDAVVQRAGQQEPSVAALREVRGRKHA